MPNFVLNRSDLFPVGTTVGAYLNATPAAGHDGAPPGTAVESQAIGAGGTATFTTLAADTPYVFAANVSGTWRKVRARIGDSIAARGIATGIGSTTSGSKTVTSASTTVGTFTVGQRIAGPGIEPGTRIRAVSGGTLTLTDNAKATGVGVALEAFGANDKAARIIRDRTGRGTS